MVESHREQWLFMRPLLTVQCKRRITIASIDHSEIHDKKTKLSDIKLGKLISPDDAHHICRSLAKRLSDEMKVRGDHRMINHDQVALDFMDSTFSDGLAIYQSDKNPCDAILDHFKIDKDMLRDNMTISEIAQFSVINEKLKITSEKIGINYETVKNILHDNLPPSLFLESEIHKETRSQLRGNASNINDKYLAAFALYTDLIEVDKRTLDSFERIKRKNTNLTYMIGQVFRLKKYADISKVL